MQGEANKPGSHHHTGAVAAGSADVTTQYNDAHGQRMNTVAEQIKRSLYTHKRDCTYEMGPSEKITGGREMVVWLVL